MPNNQACQPLPLEYLVMCKAGGRAVELGQPVLLFGVGGVVDRGWLVGVPRERLQDFTSLRNEA